MKMEQDGRCCIFCYQESKHHEVLKDALFQYLLSLVSASETELACPPQLAANKSIPSTPSPSDKVACCAVDMPVQLKFGASLIHETINLEKDFPYLHELGITIKRDWNICRLQRELEKLASMIDLVNLDEIVSDNDHVQT